MKIVSVKRMVLMPFIILVAMLAQAQQTAETFVLETKYLLYLPGEYASDTTRKWPLMIFLHGSGESGTDLQKVKAHGPPKLIEKGKKFPFIVVSPQAPPETGWRTEVLKSMLDDLKKRYRVDPDRVYLTGLSMGGFGTWNFATKYPDDIAAIAPVCGGGNPAEVWKLRHMAVWCFHGAKDDVVPPAASQKMIDALVKYNPSVSFTLYPDANHNSWDITYDNDSLYTWLLAQKKFRFKPVALKPSALREYEGIYISSMNGDTLKLVLENDHLVAKTGRETIPLKASSNDHFYWDENSIDEAQFIRNKKGRLTGFTVWSNEKSDFTRLAPK